MPVTSETPAKRSETFDVLICVVMTGSQRPELSVFVQGLLAKAPHVVTVLICAAALDDAEPAADIAAHAKNARQTDRQSGFIRVSLLLTVVYADCRRRQPRSRLVMKDRAR